MTRPLEFRYVFQHDETGRIIFKHYHIFDIETEQFGREFLEMVQRHTTLSRDQYTGLNDKNGGKIWEGDKYRKKERAKKYTEGVIVFKAGAFFCSSDENSWSCSIGIVHQDQIEIIGNKWEDG